jgi:hypothetical protein
MRLDQALVRLATDDGLALTQAIGSAIHSLWPGAAGVAYRSRPDDDSRTGATVAERCWALWDTTEVDFLPPTMPLSPIDPDHRRAVASVAAQLKYPLSEQWGPGLERRAG